MYAIADYAQPLRAIGQALETLNLQAFEMEPAGEAYFIRGAKTLATPDIAHQRIGLGKFRAFWGMISEPKESVNSNGPSAMIPAVTSMIELNYTPKDVERLEIEGRAKRGACEDMHDPTSLSQLLRCIGAYLTQKVARLQKLSWEGDALFVAYETSLGSRIQETLAASDLYDLWVRMYLQRASRTTH